MGCDFGWQEDEDGGPASVRAEYTGIGVEVKFAAGTKVHKMRELSGGQQVSQPMRCYQCSRDVPAALRPLVHAHGMRVGVEGPRQEVAERRAPHFVR